MELLKELKKEIKQNEVIIHLHDFHNWQAYAICALFKNCPIVGHYHGVTKRPLEKIKDLKKSAFFPIFLLEHITENYTLKNINHYLLSNTQDKNYFLKKKYKYSLCPMALDLEIFRPMDKYKAKEMLDTDSQKKIILNVGGFAPQKNIELLLLTFSEIIKVYPAILYLIGPTYSFKYQRKILRMIKKLQLEKDVKILDIMPRRKLNIYYNAADVLAVPSKNEGGPTVILEALAVGTPVVSTSVGFVDDIISKTNGLLKISGPSPSEFTNSILGTIQKSNKASYSPVKVWSWNDAINTIKPIYENLFSLYSYNPKLAAQKTIQLLGQTYWYSSLHQQRFIKTLEMIKKYVDFRKKLKVLDIGSWPGYLSVALLKMGADVTAIDLKSERLEVLKQFGIPIIEMDLNKFKYLPFENNSYDCVIFSETIEHINPKNVPKILREIKRILKPNGIILLTTPNKFRLGNILSFQKHNKNISDDKNSGYGHKKEYSNKEIKRQIENYDMEILKLKLCNFYSFVGKIETNNYFYSIFSFWKHKNKLHNLLKIVSLPLLFFIPTLRDSIIVITKKKKNENFRPG